MLSDGEAWDRLKRALAHPAQDAEEEVFQAKVDRICEKLNEWLALQYAEDERNGSFDGTR